MVTPWHHFYLSFSTVFCPIFAQPEYHTVEQSARGFATGSLHAQGCLEIMSHFIQNVSDFAGFILQSLMEQRSLQSRHKKRVARKGKTRNGLRSGNEKNMSIQFVMAMRCGEGRKCVHLNPDHATKVNWQAQTGSIKS